MPRSTLHKVFLGMIFWLGMALLPTCFAADNGVYLGLGLTQAKVDSDLSGNSYSLPVNGRDTKFKIIGGLRPLNWLAIEANYINFGTADVSTGGFNGRFDLKGYDAFAVGLASFTVVDLYGKAGIVRWNSDTRVTGSAASVNSYDSDSGYDQVFGAGVQVRFGSLSVRGEYERFNISAANKPDMITVGVTWTFL